MPNHITAEEMERIVRFAETPGYERTPDQLLPGSTDVDE